MIEYVLIGGALLLGGKGRKASNIVIPPAARPIATAIQVADAVSAVRPVGPTLRMEGGRVRRVNRGRSLVEGVTTVQRRNCPSGIRHKDISGYEYTSSGYIPDDGNPGRSCSRQITRISEARTLYPMDANGVHIGPLIPGGRRSTEWCGMARKYYNDFEIRAFAPMDPNTYIFVASDLEFPEHHYMGAGNYDYWHGEVSNGHVAFDLGESSDPWIISAVRSGKNFFIGGGSYNHTEAQIFRSLSRIYERMSRLVEVDNPDVAAAWLYTSNLYRNSADGWASFLTSGGDLSPAHAGAWQGVCPFGVEFHERADSNHGKAWVEARLALDYRLLRVLGKDIR